MLQKLISKGDQVSLVNGRLVITPASGQLVPNNWLMKNAPSIVGEIAQFISKPILSYQDFQVGKLGGSYDGVRLNFLNLSNYSACFACFNAELKSKRKSKSGQAGTPYSGKMFRVGDRSAFKSLWLKLGLEVPQSNIRFYKSMGKLKPVFITGDIKNGKIINSTIQPLSISHQQLINVLNGEKQGHYLDGIGSYLGHNRDLERGHSEGTKHTVTDHVIRGLESISNHGDFTAGLSTANKVIKDNGIKLAPYIPNNCNSDTENNFDLPPIKVEHQNEHAEWLADYGEVDFEL